MNDKIFLSRWTFRKKTKPDPKRKPPPPPPEIIAKEVIVTGNNKAKLMEDQFYIVRALRGIGITKDFDSYVVLNIEFIREIKGING